MTKDPLCPHCGSQNVQKRGRQIWCKDCGKYSPRPQGGEQAQGPMAGGSHTVIETKVPRIMKDEDLLQYLNVDPGYWKIDKVIYGHRDGYRKDRSVEWDVENGVVIHGKVRDSGKLLVETMVSVKVFLSKREPEIAAQDLFTQLLQDARDFAPKYPKINYKTNKDGLLFELGMPDIHLGLLAWAEESGKDADLKLTVNMVHGVVDDLLSRVQGMPISKILFPVGNDYFNVNDKREETMHGTRQQEDTRWQKTFRTGCRLMVDVIDKCTTIAPVDILVIPGNHDEERSFYLGEFLTAWYRQSRNVSVDNRACKRKYYQYGVNLIGLTHGYYEKLDKLAGLMAYEQPELWGLTRYREWHLGDKHHKREMLVNFGQEMDNGVVIRILRSLSAPSTWAFDKGFVAALRASEGFLWHPSRGLLAQFPAVGG